MSDAETLAYLEELRARIPGGPQPDPMTMTAAELEKYIRRRWNIDAIKQAEYARRDGSK